MTLSPVANNGLEAHRRLLPCTHASRRRLLRLHATHDPDSTMEVPGFIERGVDQKRHQPDKEDQKLDENHSSGPMPLKPHDGTDHWCREEGWWTCASFQLANNGIQQTIIPRPRCILQRDNVSLRLPVLTRTCKQAISAMCVVHKRDTKCS